MALSDFRTKKHTQLSECFLIVLKYFVASMREYCKPQAHTCYKIFNCPLWGLHTYIIPYIKKQVQVYPQLLLTLPPPQLTEILRLV